MHRKATVASPTHLELGGVNDGTVESAWSDIIWHSDHIVSLIMCLCDCCVQRNSLLTDTQSVSHTFISQVFFYCVSCLQLGMLLKTCEASWLWTWMTGVFSCCSFPVTIATLKPAHLPLMVNANDFRAWTGSRRPFKPSTEWLWRAAWLRERHWSPARCGRDTTLWLSSESPHDMSVTRTACRCIQGL